MSEIVVTLADDPGEGLGALAFLVWLGLRL